MIDAKNTFRKVNQTINDFSPEQLEGMTAIIKNYRGEAVDFYGNEWLKKTFTNNKYEDIEGLCKVAKMEDIKENEYSLNPGRYVGFRIQIDEDFDYKKRMKKIHEELVDLNNVSNKLMKNIVGLQI